MAIQFRRGAFADFIKSKMVAGEPAVVQSGDTSTQNGKAFYICYTPGSVDRVLTEQDKTALDSQISDIEDDLAAAEQAIESVRQSIPAVDATLTTTGAAADAKKTGDEISDLKSDLDDKVDIQQDNSDAGKVLGVGSDGSVSPINVFSTRVRNAFANIFQHVAYTDEYADDYYNELMDALASGEKYLVSISAVYTASGHTVYEFTPLDSLKDYIVVTANYSDGTSQTITDYTLSGALDSATSIITVLYLNKTTQINVSVSIDANLAYFLPSGTVLDGTSQIDTGVKLADTNKATTILCDVTDEVILSRTRTLMLMSDRNPSTTFPAYQLSLSSTESSGEYLKKYNAIVVSSTSRSSGNVANATHRIKSAMIHSSGNNSFQLFLSVDGNVVYNWTSETGNYISSDQTLVIGGRPDGGYRWEGTVNLLNVYTRALSVNEAKAILGVE